MHQKKTNRKRKLKGGIRKRYQNKDWERKIDTYIARKIDSQKD